MSAMKPLADHDAECQRAVGSIYRKMRESGSLIPALVKDALAAAYEAGRDSKRSADAH